MPNPKETRLKTDFEKVKKLAAESGGTLALIRTVGSPPTSYVIEYHCPSLVKESSGRLITRSQHQVEINLGANYPFDKPNARMLTPVFNPHVFPTNAICLGYVWNAAETIDVLILRIGALLQLDPKVLNAGSPANPEANLWVQNNRLRIPLGNVTFKAPADPQKRIQWT